MTVRQTTLATTSLLLVFLGSGCDALHRKKTSPPPSIPPSIENRKIDLPQPVPQPPPSPQPAPTATTTIPFEKPKPKPRRNPKKVVVPPDTNETITPEAVKPAPDPSLNAPMTSAQAEQERQQTTNLLGTAEGNLSNLHRSLSSDEQQMVTQIRNYISQSRKAMTDGDLERAYNLANKANLLSSELAKE